ncbi:hypothetical protein P3X46_022096 [Hevea brasiliensis]|uniref:LisH domain-containing protein n=1 Tax=Hevea brasiliensis TaxID=3981 RepID=A0ABQ9LJH8_HEVBR|nr:hypothetical protein P3X46_022096 [Hevea brasiliensis]
MDDYTREMMDLKTLITQNLEKKGLLAKIRGDLRASVFEAIQEEGRVIEKEEGLPLALLGSRNDRAKQLHVSPSGRLLTASICEYLDWAYVNYHVEFVVQNLFQGRGTGRRVSEVDSLSNLESRNVRRPSSSSVACGLPPLGRPTSSQASDRRVGSSMSDFRKDEYNWRYDTSAAVEILQFDRKARNLTTKAHAGDRISDDHGRVDHV